MARLLYLIKYHSKNHKYSISNGSKKIWQNKNLETRLDKEFMSSWAIKKFKYELIPIKYYLDFDES